MSLKHEHFNFRVLGILVSIFALLLGKANIAASSTGISREILSLYFNPREDNPRLTPAHQYGEIILNHLGLTVRHYNLRNGLPSLQNMENVKGILAWFNSVAVPDPNGFIHWAIHHIESGKRFVLLGYPAFVEDLEGTKTPKRLVDRLIRPLGLKYDDAWVQFTYDLKLLKRSEFFTAFEGPLPNPLPPFFSVQAISPQTNVILSLTGQKGSISHVLAALSPVGGYGAQGYILNLGENQAESKLLYWIINPLEFFRSAFDTDKIPKPDTSTLMGQRIYYSHIDGDGWNNFSEITDDQKKRFIAAEIILERVISAFPSLPVTVAPIAADLHPDWRGTKKSREVARNLFSYPSVEAGTHTFTHPYNWRFFDDYTTAKEDRYRSDYLSILERAYKRLLIKGENLPEADTEGIGLTHGAPRAYLDEPFSLTQEIAGSVDYIESLTPPGKQVKILHWTGDTKPFERAIAATETLGIANINGGDARLSAEFPSLASLAPVGLQIGDQLQIYSSNSNENSYTSLWTDPYFGFRSMLNTLRRTESPIRIKPFNLYYHMSSGEKMASLNAVLDSLKWAKSAPLTPITTSHYAMIGKGFFSTRFIQLAERRWKILNRGALQTIRFDKATSEAVDFERSTGIIGQRHYQGSLYVALDEAVQEPVLALKPIERTDILPLASRPYLVSSRWRVWDFQYDKQGSFSFVAQGFGDGHMEWRTFGVGVYEIVAYGEDGKVLTETRGEADAEGQLKVKLQIETFNPFRVTVRIIGS